MPAARSDWKVSSARGSSKTLAGARRRGVEAAARSARVRRGRRWKPSSRKTFPIARRLGAAACSASRRALMSGTDRFALRNSITRWRTSGSGRTGARPGASGGRKKNAAGSSRRRKSRVIA